MDVHVGAVDAVGQRDVAVAGERWHHELEQRVVRRLEREVGRRARHEGGQRGRHVVLAPRARTHQRADRADAALQVVHLQQHRLQTGERQREALALAVDLDAGSLQQPRQHALEGGGVEVAVERGVDVRPAVDDEPERTGARAVGRLHLQPAAHGRAGAGLARDPQHHGLRAAVLGAEAGGLAAARVVARDGPVLVREQRGLSRRCGDGGGEDGEQGGGAHGAECRGRPRSLPQHATMAP